MKYREKTTNDYEKRLKNQISIKQKELEALKKTEPKAVLKPITDNINEEMKKSIKELEILKKEKQNITQEITSSINEVNNLTNKKATLDKAIAQIRILKESTDKKVKEIETLLRSVGYINIDFVSFQFDIKKLENESQNLNDKLKQKNKRLIEADDCLMRQKLKIEDDIKKLSEKIDEPNKKYQNYLLEVEKWNQKISSIQGNEKIPNTLSFLNSKLSELNNIPTKIKELEKQRDELVKKIYAKINQSVIIHKDYYSPVQNFLNTKPFEKDAFNISFNVSIINSNFEKEFFKIIDRSKAGTFYSEDGYKK